MAIYLIGDVQGCDAALGRLLDIIGFSPSRDTAYLLGDLVNRGPASAQVIRRVRALDGALCAILGNHDLHLLAASIGVRKSSKRDTLESVLTAPDRADLLDWVAQQPLARSITNARGQRLLMVHAGVLPAWSADETMALAAEVHATLREPSTRGHFLANMYGNAPDAWSPALQGWDRLRTITNALTRLRMCTAAGRMDFEHSDHPDDAPAGLVPWFEAPARRTAAEANLTIAFGHWSTLGLINRADLLALDTGCVWGGCLTAMALARDDFQFRTLFETRCPRAQNP